MRTKSSSFVGEAEKSAALPLQLRLGPRIVNLVENEKMTSPIVYVSNYSIYTK